MVKTTRSVSGFVYEHSSIKVAIMIFKQLARIAKCGLVLVSLSSSFAFGGEIVVVPFSQANPFLPHITHENANMTLKAVIRNANPGQQYRVTWDVNRDGDFTNDAARTYTADSSGNIRDIGRTLRTGQIN